MAEPLTVQQAAILEAVRPTPAGRPPRVAHDCLHAAVVVTPGGERVWYPCRHHERGPGGTVVHCYGAHWPPCHAPWCRLPYSHYLDGTMHEIPPGTVALVGPTEAIPNG